MSGDRYFFGYFDRKIIQENKFIQKCGLSSGALKLIAAISMVLDHVACAMIKDEFLYSLFRYIGRLSFPIFCYVLVESFFYTSSKGKFLSRLILFAVISEIPYDLAIHKCMFYWDDQNVFWQLAAGVIVMWVSSMIKDECESLTSINYLKKYLGTQVMMFIAAGMGMAAMYYFKVCYSYGGILLLLLFYYLREHLVWQLIANIVVNIGLFGGNQVWAAFAVIPMALYNGKKGIINLKWGYYLFYPVHLLIIYIISEIFCR